MAVMRYTTMPDAATQAAIAARGDTIEIVPRETPYGTPQSTSNGFTPQYLQNPTNTLFTGDGSVTSNMNPAEFATLGTAKSVADMMGGNVLNLQNQFVGGGMSDPWYYNQLPGEGTVRNSGLLADLVQKYGYNPEYLKSLLANDGPNSTPQFSTNPSTVSPTLAAPVYTATAPPTGTRGTYGQPPAQPAANPVAPATPGKSPTITGANVSTLSGGGTSITRAPQQYSNQNTIAGFDSAYNPFKLGAPPSSGLTSQDPSIYYGYGQTPGPSPTAGSYTGTTYPTPVNTPGSVPTTPLDWRGLPVGTPLYGYGGGGGTTPPATGGGGGTQPPPTGGGGGTGGTGGGGGGNGSYNPYPGQTTFPHYGGTGYGLPSPNGQGYGTNGFTSYSYPGPAQPFFSTNGEDIQYRAENDRNMAIGRGESIDADLLAYLQNQSGRSIGYEGAANDQYGRIANGTAGYTPEEQAAIARLDELYGNRTTGQQFDSNYLTGDEISRYYGNPYESTDRVREGLAIQEGNLGDLRDRSRQAVAEGANNVNNTINQGRLTTSQDFLNNYNFTPADEQQMVEQAGRGVGYQTQADIERIQQDAAARGSYSPLSIAAALDRQRQTGDINSANAMTNARIAARQLGLNTTMGREQTRLGAEQNYANLASANQQQLAARNLASEQNIAQQRIANQQWGTNLATDAWRQAEQAASQRALGAATNRQGVNQYNQSTQYGQGMDAYSAARSANQLFAGTRLGQEQELRSYLGGMQNQANQNTTTGLQQRIGNYGTQTGAQAHATQNAITNYAVPGLGERLAGLAIKGAGAAAGAAGGFADGGIPCKGQPALVGEAGPELIIDLKKYKPMHHADDGGLFMSPDDPGLGSYGNSGYDDGTSGFHKGSAYDPRSPGQRQNRQNSVYDKILLAALAGTPAGGLYQGVTGTSQNDEGGIGAAGLLGQGLSSLFRKMADGGVVEPQGEAPKEYRPMPAQAQGTPQRQQQGGGMPTLSMPSQAHGSPQGRPFNGGAMPQPQATMGMQGGAQPFNGGMPLQAQAQPQMPQNYLQHVPAEAQSKQVAPGVTWVNGPQVRKVGEQPTAVVPLTPRPNAKVTMKDIPMLAAKYQGYGVGRR